MGLKELRTQHRSIAHMRFSGMRPEAIADQLGMEVQSIYGITRDPLFKAYLDSLDDAAMEQTIDVRRELEAAAQMAVKKVKEHIGSIDEKVSLKASLGALDRAGYGKIQTLNTFNVTKILSDDKLAEVKSRMEAAKQAGLVIGAGTNVIDVSAEPRGIEAPTPLAESKVPAGVGQAAEGVCTGESDVSSPEAKSSQGSTITQSGDAPSAATGDKNLRSPGVSHNAPTRMDF